jgi:hypothetical protein
MIYDYADGNNRVTIEILNVEKSMKKQSLEKDLIGS